MAPKLLQTCLEVSDRGNLTFVSPRPLITYPGLAPRSRWPNIAAADFKTSDASNLKAPILQLPNELLRLCLQAVDDLDIKLSEDEEYCDRYNGRVYVFDSSEEDDHELAGDDSSYEDDRKCSADDLWPAERRVHVRYEAIYALTLTCKEFHAIAVPMLYARPHFYKHYNEKDLLSQKFYNTMKRNPSWCPFVKHLAVSYKAFRHELVQMALTFPNLQSLVLTCPYDNDHDYEEEGGGGGPSPEKEGTASLTELRLHHTYARPGVVKRFLKWPRQLKVFALDDMTFDGYDWDYAEPNPRYRWSHALLPDVLSPQRHNLRVLELGWMGYTLDQNLFDVSQFTNLHTLQLCVAYEKPNAMACRNWLTVTLQTIILDLGPSDSQCGKGSSFTLEGRHRDQVVDFVKLASEERNQRSDGVGLKQIGFVAWHTNDYALRGDKEWSCDGEDHKELCKREDRGYYPHRGSKTEILKTLKAIEAHGFSAFWIGASGVKHTAQMMMEACSICADAVRDA